MLKQSQWVHKGGFRIWYPHSTTEEGSHQKADKVGGLSKFHITNQTNQFQRQKKLIKIQKLADVINGIPKLYRQSKDRRCKRPLPGCLQSPGCSCWSSGCHPRSDPHSSTPSASSSCPCHKSKSKGSTGTKETTWVCHRWFQDLGHSDPFVPWPVTMPFEQGRGLWLWRTSPHNSDWICNSVPSYMWFILDSL